MAEISMDTGRLLPKLVFLGSGNLATQLSLAFHKKGYHIVQVYSRTNESAAVLAGKLGCSFTSDVSLLSKEGDIYICALKDLAITEVLSKTNLQDKLILHTAGSIPMDILSAFSSSYGVLYPLQTLSKERQVDFSAVPVFIEGNSEENLLVIKTLAENISGTVYRFTSSQRMHIHLAAVFVCNFVNHLYVLGKEITDKIGVPFSVLLPLIDETAAKIHELSPEKAQTGPAVRYDGNVIDKHLELLEEDEEKQRLYRLISQHIYQLSNK
jgi:predicted short-subunit dehydrogenase-like oxidoreductase (DUF2520 family)